MAENLKLSREEIIICYKEDVERLLKFLPWLQQKSGGKVSGFYSGEGIENSSMSVPVYDSTLLSFIKEIRTTDSRYRIKTAKDEFRLIDACSLQDISLLGDILSKYVLRGDVKGAVWSEGVSNGVYLALLLKLKELMEIRDVRA